MIALVERTSATSTTSDQNPRFILHNSMGFEPGSTEKSAIVNLKSFLQVRAEGNAELLELKYSVNSFYGICSFKGSRTGTCDMVKSSHSQLNIVFSIGFALKHLVRDRDCCKPRTRTCWSWLNNVSDGPARFDPPHPTDFAEVKIPVIVVFTKYDYLVVEHFRDCSHISSLHERKVEAINHADSAFSEFTKDLKIPFTPVSTQKEAQKEYGGLLIRSVNSLLP